jgi:hypothetical protein
VSLLTLSLAIAQFLPWTDQEIIQNTSLRIPPDQIVRYANTDPVAFDWAGFGITHPREAAIIAEPLKTPQEKVQEEMARLVMSSPEEYRKAKAAAGFPVELTPAQQAARAKVLWDMAHPHQAAQEAERLKTPEQKRHRELVREAFLNPHAFNARVQQLKTPAQLEQEALSRKAILEPHEFNEELRRAKATGTPTSSR